MSRKDAPSTHQHIMPNLFADKERFFSQALKKNIIEQKAVAKGPMRRNAK